MIKQKDISAIEQMQFNLMICFFYPTPFFHCARERVTGVNGDKLKR